MDSKIYEIMNGNSKPSKFSMSNCFFDENEDEFYKNFPTLSLNELELNNLVGLKKYWKRLIPLFKFSN